VLSGLLVPKYPSAIFQLRLLAGCDGVETMPKSSMTLYRPCLIVSGRFAAGMPRTWVSNPNSFNCALTSFAEARKSGKSEGAVISNPNVLPP
jgi:hypothetical protein